MARAQSAAETNDADNELLEQLEEAQRIADEAMARADKAEADAEALSARLADQQGGRPAPPSATREPYIPGPVRPMTVRATATGYYNRYRDPDGPHAVFEITSDKFSPHWMEEVSELTDEDRVSMATEKAADENAKRMAEAANVAKVAPGTKVVPKDQVA